MKQMKIIIVIIAIFPFLCSCSSNRNENQEVKTASASIAATFSPEPKLDIPNEKQLIQCYTEEINKLTDHSIVSTSYENFNVDEDGPIKMIDVDVIVKMNDGKVLCISGMYTDDWSIISIINRDNKHCYYVSGDLKLQHELYYYDTEKQIPKAQFLKEYSIKKMKFQFPSDWSQTKSSKKQYIFCDSGNLHYISVMVNKAPYKTMDKLWSVVSSNYDNYSLKSKTDIKIGGKKAKQWKYTYDDGLASPTAITTMIIDKKEVYLLIWISNYDFDSENIPAYDTLLESVTWKK